MKKPSVVIAIVVLVAMGFLMFRDGGLLGRKEDLPPTIEFTWSPAGAVSLLEMKAKLRLTDDHALDFKTYTMTLVEAERTVELPLAKQLIGKEYEDVLSFSLIANDPKLVGKEKLTVRIEIRDDAGQRAELEKIIKLKPPMFDIDFDVR